MNAHRTEDDLRAVLDLLAADAPSAADVLPRRIAARTRKLSWIAPLTAALVVATVALVIALFRRDPRPAPVTSTQLAALVGIQWQVESVDGRQINGLKLALVVSPNGRFYQNVGDCGALLGRANVGADSLGLRKVTLSLGLCPATEPSDARAKSALQRLFTGTVRWRVLAGRLVLDAHGVEATYLVMRGTPSLNRNWTYRGVGITVPASWHKNALYCSTPIADTVVYPGPRRACLARTHPQVSSVEFGTAATLHTRASDTKIDGAAAEEQIGTSGRETAIVVRIPSRHFVVTIVSPSRAAAQRLEASLYIVG